MLLVTGASQGVGSVLAHTAVGAGHRVVLVARDQKRLRDSCAGLASDRILTLGADVTSWDEVSSVVEKAVAHFGRLDAVVANAGVAQSVSFCGNGGADPSDWHTMVSTNVLGTALTAKAAFPVLARSGGHLVFMGSVSGRVNRPGLYSATKWAVTAMAASIRAEAVGTGVRVTVVQPGVIATGSLRTDLQDRPKLEPEDVARAVMFALDQPRTVDVNEIVLRPVGQPADC